MTIPGKKPEDKLKDYLAIASTILGFCVALVSFVINFQKLMQDTQVFRVVSMVGFFLYFSGSIWFTFKAKNVNAKLRWANLGIFYLSSALYFIWVGTWLITPAQTPVTIDTLDSVSLWSSYGDGRGSSAAYALVPGKSTHAMELSYTVNESGYAGVTREISSGILTGTKAIGLSYKGSGDLNKIASNTIELKLIYKPDANGKSAVFSVLWNRATDVQNWTSLEAPYNLFVCWKDTGCLPGEALDPDKVWRIDIAVSNKPGDTPGSGKVLIDDIQGIK